MARRVPAFRRAPRTRPRPSAAGTRDRLLEAADALIVQRGLRALRASAVAARAGVSLAVLHRHFAGKADLFEGLVEERTARLRRRMRSVYAGAGSPSGRMAAALGTYLDFVRENPRGFVDFLRQGPTRAGGRSPAGYALRPHAADLREVVEEAMQRGELRAENPELVAQALVGVAQHVAGWWLEQPQPARREELEGFLLELSGRALAR